MPCEFQMSAVGGVTINGSLTVRCTLVDYDDEWARITYPGFKGNANSVVRIAEIEDIRAIKG